MTRASLKQPAIWLPMLLICFFGGLFLFRLINPADDMKPSAAIGRTVPAFALPAATDGVVGLTAADLRDGTPKIVNVFASWCVPCAAEAQQLGQLRAGGVIIYGIAIRDRPEDLARFLADNGNPYAKIGSDRDSLVQLSLGSSGVPESFLIDGKGVIRRQVQGVITDAMVPGLIAEMAALR